MVLVAAAIAAVGAGKIWVLGQQNGGAERYLAEVISRSGHPELKQADQFRSKDLPQLMEALSKKDSAFEAAYLWLCSELPGSVGSHLPEICPSAMIRLNAALSLGLIGSDAKAAIPALIVAVKEHRPQAATALGRMGSAASSARTTLQAASENGPEWLRRESISALHRIEEQLAARN